MTAHVSDEFGGDYSGNGGGHTVPPLGGYMPHRAAPEPFINSADMAGWNGAISERNNGYFWRRGQAQPGKDSPQFIQQQDFITGCRSGPLHEPSFDGGEPSGFDWVADIPGDARADSVEHYNNHHQGNAGGTSWRISESQHCHPARPERMMHNFDGSYANVTAHMGNVGMGPGLGVHADCNIHANLQSEWIQWGGQPANYMPQAHFIHAHAQHLPLHLGDGMSPLCASAVAESSLPLAHHKGVGHQQQMSGMHLGMLLPPSQDGPVCDQSAKHNKYCHFCQHLKIRSCGMLACGNEECTRRFCEHCLGKLLLDDEVTSTAGAASAGQWSCPVCRKLCCCSLAECDKDHRHCKAYRYRMRRAERACAKKDVASSKAGVDCDDPGPTTPIADCRECFERSIKIVPGASTGKAHELNDQLALRAGVSEGEEKLQHPPHFVESKQGHDAPLASQEGTEAGKRMGRSDSHNQLVYLGAGSGGLSRPMSYEQLSKACLDSNSSSDMIASLKFMCD